MKQIEVTILGQSYVLGAPGGGEDALMAAVKHVDREMTAIRDAGKVRARERIAVLAALNLAYALAQQAPGQTADAADPPETLSPVPGQAVDLDALDALVRRLDDALATGGRLL